MNCQKYLNDLNNLKAGARQGDTLINEVEQEMDDVLLHRIRRELDNSILVTARTSWEKV